MSRPFMFAAEADKAPRLDAEFEISGPDDDGYVWICSKSGARSWCHNLGSGGPVRQRLAQWLAEQPEERR